MIGLAWFSVFLLAFAVLAYQRASLIIWAASTALLLIFLSKFNGLSVGTIICWIIFLALAVPFNVATWRRRYITQPIFKFYRNVMPTMSRTEREAISAGTVTWEGDLFRGNPDWQKFLRSLPQN